MFLGKCFASGKQKKSQLVASSSTITSITISNAIFKELYVTNDVYKIFDGKIPVMWDFNTVLHAYFRGNLLAGNVDFTENIVDAVRIKKRTKKDIKFQTIYEKPIYNKEDLSIELLDYYEPIGDIEYAYVPVIGGGESDYIVNSVKSKFDVYFIVEKGISYPLFVNFGSSETLNYGATYVKPLNRKYPISIINGVTGYKTGSIDATFMDMNCSGTTVTPFEYREQVYEMLTNGIPKILKGYDGELYMVNIEGNIEESSREAVQNLNGDGFMNLVTSKFNWVECGNAYDTKDLYYNGFINSIRSLRIVPDIESGCIEWHML